MADTPAQFTEKCSRFVTELTTLETKVVNEGALATKTAVQAALAAAGVQSGKLRGVGKRGARIGVRYRLYPNRAYVFMYGPAQLLERDTSAHRIPREFRGRANRAGVRKRNTSVIVIPGVGVRASAMHPGTHGKHPFEKGVIAAAPLLAAASAKVLVGAMGRVFA